MPAVMSPTWCLCVSTYILSGDISFTNNEILPVYAKMNGLSCVREKLCEVHVYV